MVEGTESDVRPRTDWRDAEHYRPLLDYDCVGWAGEWLRRNLDFIADVQRAPCLPDTVESGDKSIARCSQACPLGRWGLRCCKIDEGPIFFWLPQFNPLVLTVEAMGTSGLADGLDIRQCRSLRAGVRDADQRLHLLFSDGPRTLQIILITD